MAADPLGLARALVRLDTRNPPGRERSAVALLARRLEALGATCRTIEPRPGRQSLIAEAGPASAPVLALCGHLDTVAFDAAAWTCPPLSGAIGGGRLWGRGAADMKGGVAALVEALARIRAGQRALRWRLRFLLLADEEAGSGLGAAVLAGDDALIADLAVVAEPTSLRATTSERGAAWLRFDVHGRGAHAGRPGDGRSAIAAGAELVRRLHEAPADGSAPEANVGAIAGGAEPNVIAHACRLRVDRRLDAGVTEADVLEWAHRHARAVAGAHGVAVDVALEDLCLASGSDAGHPLVAAARARLDPGGAARAFEATTDARFLRAAGTPTIVWGPGDLAVAHATDEWVAVAELEAATERLAELYGD